MVNIAGVCHATNRREEQVRLLLRKQASFGLKSGRPGTCQQHRPRVYAAPRKRPEVHETEGDFLLSAASRSAAIGTLIAW